MNPSYSPVAGAVGDALIEHFFGADKKGKLTVEMFGTFHRLLQTELPLLEVSPHPLLRHKHMSHLLLSQICITVSFNTKCLLCALTH